MANIKNKIVLPFKIIKSEVSGGFIDKVHNDFTGGIDIVNIGEDVLNNYFEANLQSPFTNQWVGGKSHRHVPVNSGEDNSQNRQEAWHVEFEPTKIKFYSHAYRNSPPAYWTREEYSKRPLNIKNVKSSGSLLAGNFTENYQVLQTSGRRITNNLIVDGFEASGVLTTQFINDLSYREQFLFSEDFLSEIVGNQVDTDEMISNPRTFVKQRVLDVPGKKYAVLDSFAAGADSIPYLQTKNKYQGLIRAEYRVLKNNDSVDYDTSGLNLDKPDDGEDLVLQYSIDGSVWITIRTIMTGSNIVGSGILEQTFQEEVELDEPAYLRFRETPDSGLNADHYAITDISFTSLARTVKQNEYLLPDLNKISGSRSVIVERFNAPGSKEESSRGALDREGEEISPNIPLPYRNIKIRQPFYRQLAQHSPQFGSGSTYALLPETGSINAVTIHKTNRNKLSRAGREYFDNGFVTHAIPRTDIQYSWITASATTTAAELGGYQSFKNIDTSGSYYNRSHAYQDISFIDGTHFGFFESYLIDEFSLPILLDDGSYIVINNEFTNLTLDNVYINSLIKDYKSIDLQCRTFTTTIEDIVPTYAEVTNSPYTFTTWTSIRTGQHPVSRLLRKNNLISTKDSCNNYTDPAVSFKYRPLEHNIKAFGQDDVNYNIVHTYTNNLSSWANKDLLHRLYEDLEKDDSEQFYDELYDLYTSPDGTSPITDFVSYIYKENIWPKEENTSLAKTRKRNVYYLNISGSSRDGYDRQLGTQRAFWRDEQQDRKRSTTDYGGYTSSLGYSSLQETGSLFNFSNQSFPLQDADGTTYSTEYDAVMVPEAAQKIGLHNSLSILENISEELRIATLECEIITGSLGGQILFAKRENLKFDVAGEFNHNFVETYGANRYLNDDYTYDAGTIYSNTYYKTLLTSNDSGDASQTIKTDNDEIILNPKLRYVGFVGGAELNTGSAIENNFFLTDKKTVVDPSFNLFTASLSSSDVYFSTIDYGLVRTTEQDSGRKPFFDSYEDYLENVRGLSKDYSTIPEFKISDHMSYYKNDNFRLQNEKIFILDGQSSYQSAQNETGSQDAQFYKSYLQSDLLKRHDKIKQENRENSQIKSIKIKVSGIKKLLPYNGFYPQDRSVQLANLYGDYVDETLSGGLYGIQQNDYGERETLLRHYECSDIPLEAAPAPPAPAPEEPLDCNAAISAAYSIDDSQYTAISLYEIDSNCDRAYITNDPQLASNCEGIQLTSDFQLLRFKFVIDSGFSISSVLVYDKNDDQNILATLSPSNEFESNYPMEGEYRIIVNATDDNTGTCEIQKVIFLIVNFTGSGSGVIVVN